MLPLPARVYRIQEKVGEGNAGRKEERRKKKEERGGRRVENRKQEVESGKSAPLRCGMLRDGKWRGGGGELKANRRPGQ